MGALCACSDSAKTATDGNAPKQVQLSFLDHSKLQRQGQTSTSSQGSPTKETPRKNQADQGISEESEQYFQRNKKFFKIKQANLLDLVHKMQQIFELSKSAEGKVQIEKYLEQCCDIMLKLDASDPEKESYNDLAKSIYKEDSPRASHDTQSQKEGSTVDEEEKHDLFKIEYTVRELQDQWEREVVGFEKDRLQQMLNSVVNMLIQVFKSRGLNNEHQQLEEILQRQDFSELYNELPQYIPSYLLTQSNLLVFILDFLLKYSSSYQQILQNLASQKENIEQQSLEFQKLKKIADLKIIASPEIGSKMEKEYQNINRVLEKIHQAFDKQDQDVKQQRNKLVQVLLDQKVGYVDLENKESQIRELEQSMSNELTDLNFELKRSIITITILLNRANLFDFIDSQLERNSQVATELTLLELSPQQCISLEASFLLQRSALADLEDTKGFLEESDLDQACDQLIDLLVGVASAEYTKEQVYRHKEMQQLQGDIGEVIEKYKKMIASYSTKFSISGGKMAFGNNDNYNNWAEKYQIQVQIQRKLETYLFGDSYKHFVETLLDQFSNTHSHILNNNLENDSQFLNEMEEQLRKLNLEKKEERKKTEKEFMSPKFLEGESMNKLDTLLNKIMIDSQNAALHFPQPLFIKVQQTNTFNVYALKSPISYFTTGTDYDLVKMKIVDDATIIVKLGCGAYIELERMFEIWAAEMNLDKRYGIQN